jgi:hypothetical protein
MSNLTKKKLSNGLGTNTISQRSWDSSVGIAMSYGLDDRCSIPSSYNISLIFAATGTHSVQYPMGIVSVFP